MLSIFIQLTERAQRIAKGAVHQAVDRDHQKAEVDDREAQLLTEREKAGSASQRLADYQAQIGSDYQCPDCWINRGIRAPLDPISDGGVDGVDRFRCRSCVKLFEFPFGR